MLPNVPAITTSREAECGCWTETVHHPDGELLELHVQICERHMNLAFEELDLRLTGEKAQLTLPLPSREGD